MGQGALPIRKAKGKSMEPSVFMMKKFVLLSVLMTLLLSAWAQSSPNYILNDQTSKAFDVYAGTATRFVAEEDGNLLVTSRSFKNLFVARVQDDIMVRWVDKSLNVKQEFVLEGSRSYDLLTASMADDEVVLLVKYWEKKQLVVKRVILDKATLQVKGEEVLYTHEEPIMGLDLCWTAVSEDGSFTALMALTASRKTEAASRVFLLDDHLAVLWDREPAFASCYGVWVSNEGDIYMADADNNKVFFAKLNEDDNYQYYVEAPSYVGTMRLLNVVDDCIVVGGTSLYADNSQSRVVKGYFGMSYNMKTGRLAGSDFKNLTPDEIRVIQNLGKRSGDFKYCDPLSVVSHAATSYGGAMALSNLTRTVITNQNGGSSEYYTQGGLLTFGVNSLGEVTWHYPIRHFEKANSNMSFSQPMMADGDNVFLFLSEDSKASLEYSIEKVQKKKNPLKNSNDLVMYTFGEGGMKGKTIVAPKQTGILAGGSPNWLDDHYYLIYSGDKKSGLMIFNKQN